LSVDLFVKFFIFFSKLLVQLLKILNPAINIPGRFDSILKLSLQRNYFSFLEVNRLLLILNLIDHHLILGPTSHLLTLYLNFLTLIMIEVFILLCGWLILLLLLFLLMLVRFSDFASLTHQTCTGLPHYITSGVSCLKRILDSGLPHIEGISEVSGGCRGLLVLHD
jgi:hypothetical protein